MSQDNLLHDVLSDISSSGPLLSDHQERMEACLRHFAARQLTLSTISGPRYLNRAESTLKRYAQNLGLQFPDYIPMALRPPKPEKLRKERKPKP